MARFKVKETCRTIIKPSSPTPANFRRYSLSLLDQLAPPIYLPFVFFYDDLDSSEFTLKQICNKLKTSLADVLVHYYPLSGRLRDSLYVDCNDEGVLFVEADVKCPISEITVTEENFLRAYSEFVPAESNDGNESLLAVQVNIFSCGNIGIGVRVSHKISDGISFMTFMRDWAATARGEGGDIRLEFISAVLFPPEKEPPPEISLKLGLRNENNVVCKRFAFSGTKIAALRARYAGWLGRADNPIHPTRIEALTAFIWNRFAASTGLKPGPNRTCLVVQAVNLRTRMEVPLSDGNFGNIYRIAVATPSEEDGEEWYGVVSKLRESLTGVNAEYIRKLQQGGWEHMEFLRKVEESMGKGETTAFCFKSWSKVPVYEAGEFGWGEPAWVAWGGACCSNTVVLLPAKCGDGIEAWVHLKEEDMAKFEEDDELLQYVTTDPAEEHTSNNN